MPAAECFYCKSADLEIIERRDAEDRYTRGIAARGVVRFTKYRCRACRQEFTYGQRVKLEPA